MTKTWDEAWEAQDSVVVKSPESLSVGTKLYFTDCHIGGIGCHCLESLLLLAFGGSDGFMAMGEEYTISVRRLLGIHCCRTFSDPQPNKFGMRQRSRFEWMDGPPSEFADFFVGQRSSGGWFGSSLLEKVQPSWMEGDHEDTRVAVWTTTARVKYACRLEHVETVLRTEEVSRVVRAAAEAAA